jgi:hypothetical protein
MNQAKQRVIIIAVAVIGLAVISGGIVALRHLHTTSSHQPPTAPTQTSSQNQSISSRTHSSQSTSGNPPDRTKAVAQPQTVACDALTLSAVQSLLGNTAHVTTPTEIGMLQATDTEVASCAYASATDSVQLSIRTAKGSLGASENATLFGSEKPTGVTDMQGYGQSAYWDPTAIRLNILSHNNWYAVTTSQHTLPSAAATAKLIKGL